MIDERGEPTGHFGDPNWVFLQYRRAQGDGRSDADRLADGRQQLAAIRGRGVFIADGHGDNAWDLNPGLEQGVRQIYADAKQSIWAELAPAFIAVVPNAAQLATRSADRSDYILHPETGERLGGPSLAAVRALRERHAGRFDVQIVVSDGLNALAIMDEGHLLPFLEQMRGGLVRDGYRPAPEHLVVTSGRVRAGYRIGETLFGDLPGHRVVLHLIGERPGSGHRTFSVYITAAPGSAWGRVNQVDHNITKVVSGIATTALDPRLGADETVRLLNTLI